MQLVILVLLLNYLQYVLPDCWCWSTGATHFQRLKNDQSGASYVAPFQLRLIPTLNVSSLCHQE